MRLYLSDIIAQVGYEFLRRVAEHHCRRLSQSLRLLHYSRRLLENSHLTAHAHSFIVRSMSLDVRLRLAASRNQRFIWCMQSGFTASSERWLSAEDKQVPAAQPSGIQSIHTTTNITISMLKINSG